MTKTKLVFVAMALALVAWVGASAASAQDGPTLTVSPSNIAEPGEVEVTVTGSGWTLSNLNVLACKIAEDAVAADLDVSENCALAAGNLDLASVTPAEVVDGGFEVTLTVNVPAQGLFIIAGASGSDESGSALITVGADDMADDMDDDMGDDMDDDMADDMDDDMADDMADDMGDDDMGDDDMDDDMADDMGDDDMADDMDDDMLADTGSNTPLLAIVALAVVLAGAMVLGLSRRLRTQQ